MKNLRILFYIAVLFYILSYFIPFKVIDPELAPYEQEYLNYVHKYCKPGQYFNNPIQKVLEINDLPVGVIARCTTNGYTNFFITYNKRYWIIEDKDSRMITMFHELTHCYFLEQHNPDPKNFMYEYENYLPLQTVQNQLEEYLQKKCK